MFSYAKNRAYDFFAPKKKIIPEGQVLVLKKLKLFLATTAPTQTLEIQATLGAGHCDGLSRCHGIMHHIGKLSWWEAALYQITQWDDTVNDLSRLVLLPDAESNKAIPLQVIIERVLNYVITLHVSVKAEGEFNVCTVAKDFRLSNTDCISISSPKNPHFEIVDDKTIKTIKKRTNISGYLTKEQIHSLLDEPYLTGALCGVHSDSHAIQIGYLRQDQWYVYDPNYPHNLNPIIHKVMQKDQLIAEIIKIQRQSLTFEIAHTKLSTAKNIPLQRYQSLLKNNLPEILRGNGLQHIIRHVPYYLPQILNKAETDLNCALALSAAFAAVPDIVHDGIRKIIILKPGLRSFAESSPNLLARAMLIVSKVLMGKQKLEKAIADFANLDSWGRSGLGAIARYNPAHFDVVLNQFVKYKKACRQLVATIIESELVLFDRYISKQLPRLIKIALKNADGFENIIKGLIKASYQAEEVQLDAKQAKPTVFERLLHDKSDNLDGIVQLLLQEMTKEKLRILCRYPLFLGLLAQNMPVHFEKILDRLNKDDSGNSLLQALLKIVPQDPREDSFLLLIRYARVYLPEIIKLLAKEESGVHRLIVCLSKKIQEKTCFEYIFENKDKHCLPIMASLHSAIVKSKRGKYINDVAASLKLIGAGGVICVAPCLLKMPDNDFFAVGYLSLAFLISFFGAAIAVVGADDLAETKKTKEYRKTIVKESGELLQMPARFFHVAAVSGNSSSSNSVTQNDKKVLSSP